MLLERLAQTIVYTPGIDLCTLGIGYLNSLTELQMQVKCLNLDHSFNIDYLLTT